MKNRVAEGVASDPHDTIMYRILNNKEHGNRNLSIDWHKTPKHVMKYKWMPVSFSSKDRHTNSKWFKGISYYFVLSKVSTYISTYLSIELEGLKAIQLIDIKHFNLSLHLSTISFRSFTITCAGVIIL